MKANEIIKGLWIGGAEAQLDKTFHKKFGIKCIVNCTKDVEMPYRDIEYHQVPVDDTLKTKDFQEMIFYLPGAVNFIHRKLDIEKKPLLTACMVGFQRSCSVVVAYLSLYKGLTLREAVALVIQRRPVAFHHGNHINFIDSLLYFVDEKKKTPKSKTPKRIKSR